MDISTNGRTPHRQHTRSRAGTLLTAAAALTATALPAAATPTPTPTPQPVVLDCSSKPHIRPEEYLLACGDGNNRLINLHWHTWGTKTATATGTDLVNDCRPYCAAGRFRPYPVTVTLSNPQPWPDHPHTHRYTTIRLLYTHTTPTPLPKDITYKLVYDTPDTP
ncbi:hypothetical protein [Streptomyces sp. NRRL F-2664]|uniref:hypothetical protein n=1 Tax=Streptomyces sp. NRRL F-2664 TaxID=1463842 RepID=UPI0004CBAB42|nr:hypothetical protein [Streptomyces sp. NRRL F-2664]